MSTTRGGSSPRRRERVALLLAERGVLVEDRVREQRHAAQGDGGRARCRCAGRRGRRDESRWAWPRGVAWAARVTRKSSRSATRPPPEGGVIGCGSRDAAPASAGDDDRGVGMGGDVLGDAALQRPRQAAEPAGTRRRSCRSRALRRRARWCGRHRRPARASRPRCRPRAGPCEPRAAPRRGRCGRPTDRWEPVPSCTGTTLMTPTSASNRCAISIVWSSARFAGSPPSYASRIFFMALAPFGRRRRRAAIGEARGPLHQHAKHRHPSRSIPTGPRTARRGPKGTKAAWHDWGMTDQEARYDRIAEGYAAWWAPVHRPATLGAARRHGAGRRPRAPRGSWTSGAGPAPSRRPRSRAGRRCG